MEDRPIEIILKDDSHIEHEESKRLRNHAFVLVTTSEKATDTTTLPDILLDLLTQVIKPLFSKQQHSKLTSTGRKNLVDDGLPGILDKFSSDVLFDSEKKPLWKNGWSVSLMKYIIMRHAKILDIEQRKKSLEAHFYQLVPPVLHQIDDIDVVYKVSGCQCLNLLCNNLRDVQSEVLKRSGLADVFIEALKNNFSLLPTLTPEDESLALYEVLYPAFRSLIKARFHQSTNSEEDLRQSYLTLIFRHQLLHSLSHLSTGIGDGSTSSIPLSTLMLSQLQWIFTDMGIASVIHLQTILPLIRHVLSDPFGSASPQMLHETTKALATIIRVAWPRIHDKWWGECLRGIVSCWLNIVDDENDVREQERRLTLEEVKQNLKELASLLRDIVGEPLSITMADLCREEPLLEPLFNVKI